MRSRLQQLLGPASPWVLEPRNSAVACVVAWLFSLPLTWQHPWLALLGFSAIWSLTLALWVEAPLLQYFPLPPLTVLLIGLCLRWGLGPLLLSVGGSGGDSFLEIWIRYGPLTQLLWLCLTACLLLLALPQRKVILHAANLLPSSSWLLAASQRPRLYAQLRALACILSVYMAAYISLSFLSGAFDRQLDSYVNWNQQLWRLETPVAAFSRFRDIWFLLFPLWWQLFSRTWRFFLSVELISFFLVALLSGSRGLLMYPVLLMLFGMWFVSSSPRLLRRAAMAVILIVFILSPLISVVRDSSQFQGSSTYLSRLQSVGVALSRPEPLLHKTRWLGRDLYGCHDPYLFTPANQGSSLVGNEGLKSLLYLWIPRHLFPERPIIFDGHLIAKKLMGFGPETPDIDIWFPCFSLPADLFRRWGVPGVIIGSALVSLVVSRLFAFWYRYSSAKATVFQLLLLLLPSTYLQFFPFGTVSETVWVFLWDLPKYLCVCALIGFLVDRHLNRKVS